MNKSVDDVRKRWVHHTDVYHGEKISTGSDPSFQADAHSVGDGRKLKSSNWNSLALEVTSDLLEIERRLTDIKATIDRSNEMVINGNTGLPGLLDDIKSMMDERSLIEEKLQDCTSCKVYRFVQPATRAVMPGDSTVGDVYKDWSSGEVFTHSDVLNVIPSADGSGVVVLPQSGTQRVMVASVEENIAGATTQGNVNVSDAGCIMNCCDRKESTFWIKKVANTTPIVTLGSVECEQISSGGTLPSAGQYAFSEGISKENGNLIGTWSLGIPRVIIVRILTGGTINSGNVSFASYHRGFISQPRRCISDNGIRCMLSVKEFYNVNCMNAACPLYKPVNMTVVKDGNTYYPLTDGFGRDCGYRIRFNNGSVTGDTYIPPGTTWAITTNVASAGARIELVCELPTSGKIDFVDVSPVSGGFVIDSAILRKSNAHTYALASGVRVSRKSRLWVGTKDDYRDLILRLRQDNYVVGQCREDEITTDNVVRSSFIDAHDEHIVTEIVNAKVAGTPVERDLELTDEGTTTPAYLYEFGIRDIAVGKCKYLQRGMIVLHPLHTKPVGDVRMSISLASPSGIVRQSTYQHSSGIGIELAVRLSLVSGDGTVYRNIDIPVPYLQTFEATGLPNSTLCSGIAGERLYHTNGVSRLRFPVGDPHYMIEYTYDIDEWTSGTGDITVNGSRKRITLTSYQPSPWTDSLVGYSVLVNGSTDYMYAIVASGTDWVEFNDPSDDVEIETGVFFRIASVSSSYKAANGNIILYNISRGRFVYPDEVSVNTDTSAGNGVVTVTIDESMWNDIITASYIPTPGFPLSQSGLATLGVGRVFIEDIPDCSSMNVYPSIIMRGNPLDPASTEMIEKVTLLVSEYER